MRQQGGCAHTLPRLAHSLGGAFVSRVKKVEQSALCADANKSQANGPNMIEYLSKASRSREYSSSSKDNLGKKGVSRGLGGTKRVLACVRMCVAKAWLSRGTPSTGQEAVYNGWKLQHKGRSRTCARLASASKLEIGGAVARDARLSGHRSVRVPGSGGPRARRASTSAQREDDDCDGGVCNSFVPLPGKRRMDVRRKKTGSRATSKEDCVAALLTNFHTCMCGGGVNSRRVRTCNDTALGVAATTTRMRHEQHQQQHQGRSSNSSSSKDGARRAIAATVDGATRATHQWQRWKDGVARVACVWRNTRVTIRLFPRTTVTLLHDVVDTRVFGRSLRTRARGRKAQQYKFITHLFHLSTSATISLLMDEALGASFHLDVFTFRISMRWGSTAACT
eukprot:scaffold2656_cov365-Pavlova_lutheri.AAC.2